MLRPEIRHFQKKRKRQEPFQHIKKFGLKILVRLQRFRMNQNFMDAMFTEIVSARIFLPKAQSVEFVISQKSLRRSAFHHPPDDVYRPTNIRPAIDIIP